MIIKYISHGKNETGGYLLETSLCKALGDYQEIRYRRNFIGIAQWFLLFLKTFFDSKADVIVTVARLAWPVYLRNILNRSKIILVLHNMDENDGKPKLYFLLLKAFLRLAKRYNNKIKVVVVSRFMCDKLDTIFGLTTHSNNPHVFLFPNLFDNEKYQFYADISKKEHKLIHLGQYSDKIDKKAYHNLIYALKENDYQCYFSSPYMIKNMDFPISVFDTREAYLKQMARARFTVIINAIEEGWNRVAHESLLVGTPVMACANGGVSEIVEQFKGGFLFDKPSQIIDFLGSNSSEIDFPKIDKIELLKFHINETPTYSNPIIKWLNTK